MRTIKFRGVPVDEDCEWSMITGSLLVDIFGNTIIYHPLNTNLGGFRAVPVNPETVGQFTGLTDKNGVEIYEGDILSTETLKHMQVGWNNRFSSFSLTHKDWAFSHWFGESCEPEQCLVVGNIFENPELLQ